MDEVKPISREAVPRALEKAERYRLLNEPQEAESICLDVLATDPHNQAALVMLLLSLTDQFGSNVKIGPGEPQELLPKLRGEYERAYYAGVICERWVKAALRNGAHPGMATGWFMEAKDWYEKARALSSAGNDDAILRWNACVRFIERDPRLRPSPLGDEAGFTDDAPQA